MEFTVLWNGKWYILKHKYRRFYSPSVIHVAHSLRQTRQGRSQATKQLFGTYSRKQKMLTKLQYCTVEVWVWYCCGAYSVLLRCVFSTVAVLVGYCCSSRVVLLQFSCSTAAVDFSTVAVCFGIIELHFCTIAMLLSHDPLSHGLEKV